MDVLLALSEPVLEEKARFVAIVHTARALARAGATVRLILPDTRASVAAYATDRLGVDLPESVDVVAVRAWHRRKGSLLTWNAIVHRSIRRAVRRLRSERPAVLHVRHLKLGAAWARSRESGNPPMVFEAHQIPEDDLREAGRDGRAIARAERGMRAVLGAAAGLAAISEGLRAEIVRRYEFGGPSCVARSGVELPLFPHAWRGNGRVSAPDPPVLVFVGRLDSWKGVDTLVRALPSVPRARLVLVGGGSRASLDRIRDLARTEGVSDRIELPGPLPHREIAERLGAADVALHPLPADRSVAARDTSPLKLLEYLAVGVPVVASDVPSVRELVTHERTALLARPGDPASFAEAIGRLLSAPDLARSLSRAGREVALVHTFDARAARLLGLYEEVLRSRSRR